MTKRKAAVLLELQEIRLVMSKRKVRPKTVLSANPTKVSK